jgi:hypothetical protein
VLHRPILRRTKLSRGTAHRTRVSTAPPELTVQKLHRSAMPGRFAQAGLTRCRESRRGGLRRCRCCSHRLQAIGSHLGVHPRRAEVVAGRHRQVRRRKGTSPGTPLRGPRRQLPAVPAMHRQYLRARRIRPATRAALRGPPARGARMASTAASMRRIPHARKFPAKSRACVLLDRATSPGLVRRLRELHCADATPP